ncbi:MAG: papain-like cysteine protease family protein [Candidatus Obscuribacterales bacterium]|nr:papain-like cysteine protease family protein [Candidatus Obscuribacterales bacterium]
MQDSSGNEIDKPKQSPLELKDLKTPDAVEVANSDKNAINAARSKNPDKSNGSAWQDKSKAPPSDYQSIQITGMGKPISRFSEKQTDTSESQTPSAKSISKMELAHMQAQGDKTAESFANEYEKITQSLSRTAQAAALSDLQERMDKTYGRGNYHKENDNDDSDARPIFSKDSVLESKNLIVSGLDYQENSKQFDNRSPSEKLSDFVNAASSRISDPIGQKTYIQDQLDKLIGIGEGMNIAKEETKASARQAWTALTDGTVASFLAQPNAINDPLFHTLGRVLDAFERDPNTVNKALVLLGHQIELASEKYSALPQHEQGKILGGIVFNGFSGEPSSNSVKESLSRSIEQSFSILEKAEQKVFKDSNLIRQNISHDGKLISQELAKASDTGAGGNWLRLNERDSPDVVKQCHRLACVSACGEMLTNGEITQTDLVTRLARYEPSHVSGEILASSPQYLAEELGAGWTSKPTGAGKLGDLLRRKVPFAIELKEFDHIPHLVIADGIDEAGNIMIRDPWDATRYEMQPSEFAKFFTGRVCFKK